ncbi:MAG: hypothetical protein WC229_02810 [Candidatus Paceibacterota bacterium]|jgi:hypothetical protein
MEDTNKKTKKILSILLVIFIVFALGFLAWSSRGVIKKFFNFATVYDTVVQRAVTEGWATSSGYAWGENIGWVDFSKAYVRYDSLWGYAYGENVGWVSLNCENTGNCVGGVGDGAKVDYKVTNDGNGSLSGFAYGENIGWINFGSASSTYHVVINSEGDFTGYAWGENVGWISFNSENGGGISYKVSTTWKPSDCSNDIDDDGDGLIDSADTGCQNGGNLEKTVANRRTTVNNSNTIDVVKPIDGSQWATGNTYQIKWTPVSTTTDTFVYMIDGGYSKNRLVAYASSTDSSMDYYVTDEDLPKNSGDSWKVAVCSGEILGSATGNCGFSGAFYVNSIGKKVELVPKTDSAGSSTDQSSGGDSGEVVLTPIKTVELPVIKIEPIKLVELPKFGGEEGKDSFTFVPQIKSFVLTPLPESIANALNKFPKLKDYLSLLGFSREQDLIALNFRPISLQPLPEPVPAGLFVVSREGNNLRTQLVADEEHKVVQLARVVSGTPVTISLVSSSKVTGEWNGEKIPFTTKDGHAILEFNSDIPGRYILTTDSSPLPLAIEVLEKTQTNNQSTAQAGTGGWLSRVLGLFGR